MYNSIITKLKTLIEGTPKVQIVYDHEPKATDQYPYVSIAPSTISEEYDSTGFNRRDYSVTIRVVALLNDDFVQAQLDTREITDSILEILASNANLESVIESGLTESVAFSFITEENLYVSVIDYVATIASTRNC